MNRSDFEDSSARARKAWSRSTVDGLVTKDFKWITGRWRWFPEITEMVYPCWNDGGGAAHLGYHKRTYWLCLGWSHLEVLKENDPRAIMQRGGNDGGA